MKKTVDKSWLAIVRSQQRNPIIVDKVSKGKVGFCEDRSGFSLDTLGSGISVGVGRFGKNNKRRVLNNSRGRKIFLCTKKMIKGPRYLWYYMCSK